MTVAPTLAAIDWSMPWLHPYRDIGQRAEALVRSGHTVAEALNTAAEQTSPLPLAAPGVDAGRSAVPRFVPQAALVDDEPYEAFIHRMREVPTRDIAHDFFNGLVWLHAPALKWRLNRLQAGQIAGGAHGATRGPVRDALTLLDENGALLQAPPLLWQALQARDWHALFVEHRSLWQQAQLTLVGHALLDKLQQPRKPITAHVLAPGATLDAACLARKPFLPLPVLGVPGWWAQNEEADFYNDAAVFRPPQASAGRKPSIDR